MLDLIGRRGWTVAITSGFAGGVLVIAVNGVLGFEVCVEAEDVAAAAPKLLRKIAHYEGEREPLSA